MDLFFESSDQPETERSNARAQSICEDLSHENRLKADLILEILNESDIHIRAAKIREAAKKLQVHRTTVTRMVNRYETSGLSGVLRSHRIDKGQYRISEFWQDFILEKYQDGQKYGRRICRNQVFLQVKAHAEQVLHLKPGEYPSHVTVYKLLAPLANKAKQRVRNPGQGISRVIHTTKGDIELTHSNQVWQSDHTWIDVLIVGRDGELVGRPWLTTIIDSYSGCIMGFRLGFEQPGSFEVGLALRHAILPKTADVFQKWSTEWDLYGVPQYLFTDHGKDFEAEHTQRIGRELGFETRYRRMTEDGGAVESPFNKINTEVLAYLPGYTGSNVEKRPPNTEKFACVSIHELEALLVEYFAVHFNGHTCPRVRHQTRLERWKSMLIQPLHPLKERELDICLLKKLSRRVEKSGAINFSSLKYWGNLPKEYEGQDVLIRYDPRNIGQILVYSAGTVDHASIYIGAVKCDRFDEISLKEWKLLNQRERQLAQQIDNSALLRERRNLLKFSEEKVDQLKQKERRRRAQKRLDKERNQSKISELHPSEKSSSAKSSIVKNAIAKQQKNMMKATEAELKALNREVVKPSPVQSID